MSRSRKLGLIVIIFIISQVARFYLEGMLLWSSSANQPKESAGVERMIPPPAEHIIQDKFSVNRFYKSEGFGIDDVNPYDVTLAVHGSVDKLYNLIDLATAWKGPISMSVYAPGLDASFLDDAIDGLRLCWTTIRRNTNFHVVYPLTAIANVTDTGQFVYLSCKDIIRRLRKKKPSFLRENSIYPHNVMRNVAHSGVLTHYVLHIDADIFPTSHLRERFNNFIKRTKSDNEKSIRKSLDLYVLPVFEVRQEVDALNNKNDLVKELESKNARPYMQETCPHCHQAVNYEHWKSIISFDENIKLNISYNVEYTKGWEPFFIMNRYSSLYDERITRYGTDRLAQICSLYSQDFNFQVLNDEFLTYRGYRTKARMSDNEKKRKEDRNQFYRNFAQTLNKYGYTNVKFKSCFL